MEIGRNIKFTIPKPSAPQLRKLITFETAFLENNVNTIIVAVSLSQTVISCGV